MKSPEFITLSSLQALVKQGLDTAHPFPYWVSAEVSELKVNYSGHCYIELVEKGGVNHVPRAKMSAVIWRNTYQMIDPYFTQATGQKLAAGLKVLFKVVISYHELYGLSLQVTDIDPAYTLGDMERQRQQTITRLQEDGIFTMNHELELPLVLQRLAVVSSRNAAGFQDFMQELETGPFGFSVTLFDAFMQGEQAESSVISALDQVADRAEEFDAVIIIRGGGSQSDLGCFNSYRLCSHLAQFPLPVLTGIGHDKDQSVADLVAAVSLKTPTAVAVYLKEGVAEVDGYLDRLMRRLAADAASCLEQEQHRLQDAATSLREIATNLIHTLDMRLGHLYAELRRQAEALLQDRSARLANCQEMLGLAARNKTSFETQRLDQARVALRQSSHALLTVRSKELKLLGEVVFAHDPKRILAMGFAVVNLRGKTLLNPSLLQEGDAIEVCMHDASILAKVTGIK